MGCFVTDINFEETIKKKVMITKKDQNWKQNTIQSFFQKILMIKYLFV